MKETDQADFDAGVGCRSPPGIVAGRLDACVEPGLVRVEGKGGFLDLGGGFQVRTRCGFNFSLEAGADINDTQNYGHGSFNIFWSRPLD